MGNAGDERRDEAREVERDVERHEAREVERDVRREEIHERRAAREDGVAAEERDAPASTAPLAVYVGGYGPRIAAFELDRATGALRARGSYPAMASNPSFAVATDDFRHLYALSENPNGRVGAYAVDPATFALSPLGDVPSEGDGPAHVSLDATNRWLFVANYGDGRVAVLPVLADGRLGRAVTTARPGANAHMIVTDPTNRFVLVPCKGEDAIVVYRFDASTGALVPNDPPRVETARGAGPRHIAFHPDGQHAYVINELDNTLIAYTYDSAAGRLTPEDTQSTLPDGFREQNTAAQVLVHPSGRFVFGSNRGHDSIVVFRLDPTSGRLGAKAHFATGGRTPRHFSMDPSGRYLVVAHQDSDSVVPFRIDEERGALSPAGPPMTVAAPAFADVRLAPSR